MCGVCMPVPVFNQRSKCQLSVSHKVGKGSGWTSGSPAPGEFACADSQHYRASVVAEDFTLCVCVCVCSVAICDWLMMNHIIT